MAGASILMPNYNNAPFLKEAIDSCLNQSFRDFEFIIVDDGSTDESVQIINSYNDQRIKLIQKEKNSGIVDSLNLGLQHCTSEFIIRMDGDDISLPGRFEKLIYHMKNNPAIGVFSSGLKMFGNRNDILNVNTGPALLKAGMIHGATVPHAPCVFRASILKENQIKYSHANPHMEDYDIFFRIKNLTQFENINEILYLYRINNHNVTIKNNSTRKDRFINMYKQVLSELGMEETNENANLHYEFFQIVPMSFTPEQFNNYVSSLIKNNNRLKIYSEREFKTIIYNCWNTLCCRFIDKDKSSFKKFKKFDHKLYFRTYYYYFKNRN